MEKDREGEAVEMGKKIGSDTWVAAGPLPTVIQAVPGVATFARDTTALNSLLETKVVCKGVPFQRTEELELKPVPFTVRVKPGPPGATDGGKRGCMMLGTGLPASLDAGPDLAEALGRPVDGAWMRCRHW